MAGNAFEWVSDWFQDDYYSNSPSANPTGPSSGDYHLLRGGGFAMPEDFLKVAGRFFDPTSTGISFGGAGIRCARSP